MRHAVACRDLGGFTAAVVYVADASSAAGHPPARQSPEASAARRSLILFAGTVKTKRQDAISYNVIDEVYMPSLRDTPAFAT